MTTMTLAEFLLARVDEDEAAAEAVRDLDHSDTQADSAALGVLSERAFEFYARRVTPERVLAECEAKRRIVEDATNQHTSCLELDWVVQVLASVYADHPDFREEWRP